MGMYTQLDAQLKLKNCEEIQELLFWAMSEYDDSVINKLAGFEFFKEQRRHWFNFNIVKEDSECVEVTIESELKNYEQEIQKLLVVLKPHIIEGHYKSLYEEHIVWFDHLNDKFEEENRCPYCCSENECKNARCQY